jgi:colanic acid/amylovoran biosynthesis glycosyltransferase
VNTSGKPAGELRIAYLLNQFPCLSETFILNEMVRLEARGFRILPCALVEPRGEPVHKKAEPFLRRVVRRPPPGSAISAFDWLGACLRWPRGGPSATLLALGHTARSPAGARELLASLAAACHFARIVRAEGVQHLHAQFGSMPATVGLLLAEITGLSFSVSLHARDIFTDESVFLATKLMEAEFATVCTKHGYDRLIRTQPAAVHSRIHLVRHGIDLADFAPRARRPAREAIIAIVGRLVEKKGHEVLLRAVTELRRARGRFQVAIAGDGPLRTQLESLAERLGIGSVVNFCGPLSHDDVKALLAVARMLVVPSVIASDSDRDGLPNVILEAAAVGCPIVASGLSAIPEFVTHGETGLLVPPDDTKALAAAIREVLDDPAPAAARAARARRRVIAEFDIARNVRAIETLLRKALERREHGKPGVGQAGAAGVKRRSADGREDRQG